jgi:hypothetical protein
MTTRLTSPRPATPAANPAWRSKPSRRTAATITAVAGLTVAGVLAALALSGSAHPVTKGHHQGATGAGVSLAPGVVAGSAASVAPSTTDGANPSISGGPSIAGSAVAVGPVVSVRADLGALAPADTSLALLLPATEPGAWKAVTGLGDPRLGLVAYTPPSQVALVGYLATTDTTHSAGTGWPGADAVVLITSSDQGAFDVQAGLTRLLGSAIASVVSGTQVTVTASWLNPATVLTVGPRLATAPDYVASLTHRPAGTGTLWVNGHDWLATMATETSGAARAGYLASLDYTVPAGSSWIGAAGADARHFTGSWVGPDPQPAPDVSAAAAPPGSPCTQQVCSGLTAAPTNYGEVLSAPITVTTGSGPAAVSTLGIDLAGLQNDFGIGGTAPITTLTFAFSGQNTAALTLAAATN